MWQWTIDPDDGRGRGWLGCAMDKPFRMLGVGGRQRLLSVHAHACRGARMHLDRRVQADALMMMGHVVPGEKLLPERAGVLQRAKPLGKGRVILQRLEPAL